MRSSTVRTPDGGWAFTDPGGIPGNDDLGSMSSWYVWAAMGLYPGIPGRADLLGSDLTLEFRTGHEPSPTWGRRPEDAPPSFRPPAPR
jgi:putative alpha-1,2-mannosidase